MMMRRRNGDTRGVEPQIGHQQFAHRRKNWNRIFFRRLRCAARVRFNRGNQCDSQSSRFQFAVDTKVIAAKCSRPGNSDTQNGFAGYLYAPLPSTTFRQRA